MRYIKSFEARDPRSFDPEKVKVGYYTNSFSICGNSGEDYKTIAKCIRSYWIGHKHAIDLDYVIIDPNAPPPRIGIYQIYTFGLTFKPATPEEINFYNTTKKAEQFDL